MVMSPIILFIQWGTKMTVRLDHFSSAGQLPLRYSAIAMAAALALPVAATAAPVTLGPGNTHTASTVEPDQDYVVNGGQLDVQAGGQVGHLSSGPFDNAITMNGGGMSLATGATVLGGIDATAGALNATGGTIDTGGSNIKLHGTSSAVLNGVNITSHIGNLDAALAIDGTSSATLVNTRVQGADGTENMGATLLGAGTLQATGGQIHGTYDGIESTTACTACHVSLNQTAVSGRNAGALIDASGGAQSTWTVNGGSLTGSGVNASWLTSAPRGDGLLVFGGSGHTTATLTDTQLIGQGMQGSGFDLLHVEPGSTIQQFTLDGNSTVTGQYAGIRVRAYDLGGGVRDADVQSNAAVFDVGGRVSIHGSQAAAIDASTGTTTVNVREDATVSSDIGVLVHTTSNGTVNLNLDGARKLQTGDIVNNGKGVNFTVSNSSWRGGIQNGSLMTMKTGGYATLTKDSSTDHLAMAGGTVDVGGSHTQAHSLRTRQLDGDGTFVFGVDAGRGVSDQLIVTGLNQATGSHHVAVRDVGQDPARPDPITIVQTQGGSAQFAIDGGTANLGTFQYTLAPDGSNRNNWVLNRTNKPTPFTNSILNVVGASPTLWYGQLIPLLTRLGELNFVHDHGGLWVRPYGSQIDVDASAGTPFSQRQSGVAVGADTLVPDVMGGRAFVGGVFNYSHATLDDSLGAQGKVDTYSLGAYAAWLGPRGYYVHGLVNLNRYVSQAQAVTRTGFGRGSANTNGVGLVLEGGRRWSLPHALFVQPYLQAAGLRMSGQQFNLDNGMQGHNDHINSLQTALGVTFGATLHSASGGTAEPYVRVAAVHEFIRHNQIVINNSAFDANLSGSRVEVGAGVAVQLGQRLTANFDYTYAHGSKWTQPYMLNAGLRYTW